MRTSHRWLLALLGALVLPFAAQGDSGPQVTLAVAGNAGPASGAIERFTLRFSEPMVPLGDPRATPAATSDCPVPAKGRWVDQQTFVLDFDTPLPGGLSCAVTLRAGITTLKGSRLSGTSRFPIDTGGPSVRAVLAPGYDYEIDEDQVFLVATNVPADARSVAAQAACAVDGIGETIAVDVLPASVPGQLLAGLGETNWRVSSFLSEAGLPSKLPADARTRANALASVMALRCRRPLPPERDVALLWTAGIVDHGGKAAGRDQRFDFKVRKAFTARFECGRVNGGAACDPIRPASVHFSAPVPREKALAVRLRLADGSERSPKLSDDDKNDAQVADLQFAGPFPALTGATVVLPEGITDLSGRKLSNGERFPLAVRFDAQPPLVKFAAGFGILEASEGGVLPVTVRAVEPSLAGKATAIAGKSAKIADSDAAIADWLRKLDKAEESDYEEVDHKDGTTTTINHTREKPILTSGGTAMTLGLPGKGKDFEVVGIPLKSYGFHVVELASPALGRALLGRNNVTRYVAAGTLVTDMAVHFKWGRESSLVWVTALKSGAPVANAAIHVTDSCTGKPIVWGSTDGAGRLLIRGKLAEPETGGSCNDESSHPLMVSARLGEDMSFTLTSWTQGIAPYDFELPFGWSAPEDIIHTIFDRALVRVGERVHMKHVLRHPSAAGFAFARGFSGKLTLSHLGSDTQFTMPVTISASGSGETEWAVPQGAPLGDYSLRFEIDGRTVYTEQSVRVDEYRLPTMRATVTGPAEALVRPTAVPLSLYVGYLSGGGAGQLPVTLRTDFASYVPAPDGWDGYQFGGADVVPGTRPLDDQREAPSAPLPYAQTLPVTLGADGTVKASVDVNQQVTQPLGLTVEMDYPDANGETLTASRHLTLYPSAVQLGVKTDGWMMKNDDLRLQFVALDLSGKPLSGQTVNVKLYSREIITARRRLIGGFYAYDNQEKVTEIGATCTARTDSLGRAGCALDPGTSGEVTVVATTMDAQGRVARAVRTVWLAGEDDWWFGGDNGDRMDVIPEQTAYKAGETGRFQVRMPFRSATALVTVEREGVLSSFVTQLSGKDPVVEVAMPGAYAPNVYVSVMAVRGRVGGFKLWLADLARRWHLPFFSREGAAPTALVDLAKPSYRLGIAKVKVGWEAHRLAVAVKADRPKYAVRDTASVSLSVKDPSGRPARGADVAFVAVDEALLQLMPNPSWNILDAMMGERSLSVITSTAQMQVVGKRHYGKKAVAAGGGGGGDASAVNRENFQPVLLWRGHVALDANGNARVPVPLPDALTSFRLVAIATDGAQLFGTGETSVRTAQNLSIYSGMPPLVRTGDWYGAIYTLRNGSDHAMTVTATPAIEPAYVKVAPISVTIPAGGATTVRWNLRAPGNPVTLRWTVTARSADGKDNDKVTASQDVVPAVPVETWAASLYRVGEGAAPTIAWPAGALPGGWVDVALSDTLAPPLAGVRSYMTDYPYNCFEQRLSRIVATGDTGGWTALAASMPTYLDSDGLLRYWPIADVQGSPELTAYALAVTSAAGLAIPDESRAKMIAALRSVVERRLTRDRKFVGDDRLLRIASLAALARAGAADPALIAAIDMVPADMPTSALADWIIALDRVPSAARSAQMRATAEGELRKRLVYEGTRLDLADQKNAPWWMMTSGDEMAIKALDAVLGKPGWAAEAPRMMTGVAQRQWHGHWDTTPANAWGAVVARRFGGLYPASAVTGATRVALGPNSRTVAWPLAANAGPVRLPLVPGPMSLSQTGGVGPWATVSVRAAVPLRAPLMAGYRLSRAISVVSARQQGRFSQGDVIRVKLTIEASAERTWVVISDPLPPGATVVSDLGGQSALLKQGEASEGSWPAYVEKGRDAWRAYYDWLPRGTTTIEYTLRLNGIGHFTLPPSRVEAMYSPAIRAQLPVAPITIWAR
ncbi:alpha-2-macroglobulin [Sphingobium sp. H33]|uniref:Alpha-2-macroglobulin n=2 Tax=Sphingobium nicotianae TaxID=2782607 RepID=A0A9X1IT17_9SPHN|nr:MG2 domain-containing protein [Sphingobium nicotianae]MBT2189118.1 alpha-2-macroglobulin [Sphingobium nicotianae]